MLESTIDDCCNGKSRDGILAIVLQLSTPKNIQKRPVRYGYKLKKINKIIVLYK